jgi:hypothetical protein
MLLLGGAMTASRAVRTQQKAMPVIGYLGSTSGPTAPNTAAFHQGLSETGYVEGQNVTLEYRWAQGNYDRLPELAAELVGRKVDVIAMGGMPLALAAKSVTSTIPQNSARDHRHFDGSPDAASQLSDRNSKADLCRVRQRYAPSVVSYDSFRCSSNSVQTSNKLAECSSSSATASTMALPNM